ncbi:MAG: dynamin family protein [Planctomycetes bacterium]|nr:dynamin family protein [Planctomycetota bacterium]
MATVAIESRRRLAALEDHLARENPTLLEVVHEFRALDRVVHGIGLLRGDESFAYQVPWWPMIAVLGTFSSGKSSFVNWYLGEKLQRTGNQAVDDRFTVICHAADAQPRVLPGSALDSDPRFPFFGIEEEIARIAPKEQAHADRYLQLKTCSSEALRGKILIDSPGFDADHSRASILKLTSYLLDRCDLVLLFFDARHPEPGAMRDTLEYLVAAARERADAEKFLFVLNQMDATAREDNPEEVFAAWQRALAEKGVTSGRFFAIYNPDLATPIADDEQRARYEHKRDSDLTEIEERMHAVEVGRAYRIVEALEHTAQKLRDRAIGRLTEARARWRHIVLTIDFVLLVVLATIAGVVLARDGAAVWVDRWLSFPGADLGLAPIWLEAAKWGVVAAVAFFVHTRVRALAAGFVRGRLEAEPRDTLPAMRIGEAFHRGTRLPSSIFRTRPRGWSHHAEREVDRVLAATTSLVERLNDGFARPSGAHPSAAAHTAG